MRGNTKRAFVLNACAALAAAIVAAIWTGNPSDRAAAGSEEASAETAAARRAEGQAIAAQLMEQWRRDHPGRDWVTVEKERHSIVPPADNSHLLDGEQGGGHAYGRFTKQDLITWERELEKFVVEGSRIFHNADELGSTIAVSCDMCHPDAANTHPETYPKFQVQMGRAVLLRDMINWCIEQAVRGDPLEADDPRMRALEAYILAQRKGFKLNYGQH